MTTSSPLPVPALAVDFMQLLDQPESSKAKGIIYFELQLTLVFSLTLHSPGSLNQ